MFDPFGDFETEGYLRNFEKEKNLDIVKIAEHELFRAQLPAALMFLATKKKIEYADFLEVHRILFAGLYPWAGKDRSEILPDSAIKKGDLYFCHPRDCRRAVAEGLSVAHDKKVMRKRPGFVMGMFAYGHPFLDGNGRTMLLVHAELCFRANLSINWLRTTKQAYLEALTREIQNPNDGHLDAYLKPFIEPKTPRENWLQCVTQLPGLDGIDAQSDVSAGYGDPKIAKEYQEFEHRRAYKVQGKYA
ncbi:MAG: Fic family protein [Burkholderiaceae bacterium]|nr:Fic family protein [Burkholderiaceae bacterium]MCD8537545.1 Fic family protein [Burkholderiaceae bacterium]